VVLGELVARRYFCVTFLAVACVSNCAWPPVEDAVAVSVESGLKRSSDAVGERQSTIHVVGDFTNPDICERVSQR